MTHAERVAVKRLLVKANVSKAARADVYEYIYRQSREQDWDNRSCYGVGFYLEQNILFKNGIDYRRMR